MQSFGCPVDGGGEASRPSTHDDESKHRSGTLATVSPRYSETAPGLVRRRTSPEEITTGKSVGSIRNCSHRDSDLRIGVGIEPPVGQAGSVQELEDLEGLG